MSAIITIFPSNPYRLVWWNELCVIPPVPNSYVEKVILNLIVFGDRAFKEVINIKWSHEGCALIQ